MSSHFQLSRELELERILTLQEAIELSRLSRDTIKRRHSKKLIRLSPRRLGMRLRDALMLKENR
jgi:hypothetical protein